jgi:hypothetical protein
MKAAGRTCSAPNCSRAVLARGLCALHYGRMARHGSLEKRKGRPVTDWKGREVGTLRVTRRYSTDDEGRATWFTDCLVERGGCGSKDFLITSKHLQRGADNPDPTVPSCGCLQFKRRTRGNTREAQVGRPHHRTPEGNASIRASRAQLLKAGKLTRRRNAMGRFVTTPKGSRTKGRKEGRPRKFYGTLQERNAAAQRARRAKLRTMS